MPRLLVLIDNVGPGDVAGHQIRRELDAFEGEVEDIGERPDQCRLGQAGHALDQHVAVGLADYLIRGLEARPARRPSSKNPSGGSK